MKLFDLIFGCTEDSYTSDHVFSGRRSISNERAKDYPDVITPFSSKNNDEAAIAALAGIS